MGLLVGLPLKLFHILFVLVRLAWPLLLVLLVLYLRRRSGGSRRGNWPRWTKESDVKGPVYTVDYEIVDDEEEQP